VAAHFDGDGVVLGRQALSAGELAAVIRSQPGWNHAVERAGGRPGVILVSCGAAGVPTKSGAYPAQLAGYLDAAVLSAATDAQQQPDMSVQAVGPVGGAPMSAPQWWLFDPRDQGRAEMGPDLSAAVGVRANQLGPAPAIAVTPPPGRHVSPRWGHKDPPVAAYPLQPIATKSTQPADQPCATGAPVPGTPGRPARPQPPTRITDEGRLSASDTVISLFPGDTEPW
jgi:hypothetical protein